MRFVVHSGRCDLLLAKSLLNASTIGSSTQFQHRRLTSDREKSKRNYRRGRGVLNPSLNCDFNGLKIDFDEI